MNNTNLRMGRILLGLSQAELGRRIGKSMGWVSLVERGYLQPAPEILAAIKEIFVKAKQSEQPEY